ALLLAKGLHLLWGVRYDRSPVDVARAVAIDSQDNVIVTGSCRLGRDRFCTVKYGPDGRVLWTREYGRGTTERASGVAVDSQDNVIVVGYSVTSGYIYHLIKYDPAGRELWSRVHGGGEFGGALAVAVGPGDEIVVTGLANSDLYLLKYGPAGRLLWRKRLDCGGTEETAAVDIDSRGNIVIAGGSNRNRRSGADGDYCIVKLDPQENMLWERDYDSGGSDVAQGVAIDYRDNVIVTGYSKRSGDYDFLTLKLDPQGRELWARRLDRGGRDLAMAVAVDRAANVIVAGRADRGSDQDIYTVKYDSQGRLLWETAYDCSAREAAYGVAADSQGSVLVAGTSLGDYQLLKYSDGYLPQGSYASPIHPFDGWARLRRMEAEAELQGQEILAEIETSDDRFATVKRTARLALGEGRRSYDISGLGRARYARVRLYLRTADPGRSPLLHSLVIKAAAG
ncbi:MAG: hypothetical protein ACE5LD_05175, partial [Candidatus Bipolaricaulia bacterium]